MKQKYMLTGHLFHRHEIICDGEGNEVKTEHFGVDDGETGRLEKTLETIVPKLGDRQKVRITFELLK